jgi:hypothetical protein
LGITLPTGHSLHTELAKRYFNTQEISTELYSEGKQRTFEIMYGVTSETYGVELFERVQQAREVLWEQYKQTNRLHLPSGMSVMVENASASKIYNYYIQNLEFVRTIPKLFEVLNQLNYCDGKLVLYTYDSILLDFPSTDTKAFRNIQNILEEDGKFPVRMYIGNTYNTLQEVTSASHERLF